MSLFIIIFESMADAGTVFFLALADQERFCISSDDGPCHPAASPEKSGRPVKRNNSFTYDKKPITVMR
ncbi:hypothetical protein [Niveispirillum irakense]|uniref:hypothetical protein n=1 Tax=Niveispirillum irakense TaxID=34011 RepID=UPI0012B60D4F|nr:hypothetical protein [Niveispirillum irakense]